MTTLASALIGAGIGYAYYHYIGCISGTCPIQTNPVLSTLFGAVMAMLILPDGYNWLRKTLDGGRGTSDVSYANISRELFLALKDQPDTVVLDVRTTSEWNAGHVEGARLIDFNAPDFRTRVDTLDRSKTYLLYCRSGRRSALAADIMVGMGFTDVKNVNTGQRGLF